MIFSCITKYELDLGHGEKVEFSLNELIAFIIWSVQSYHEKIPSLAFNMFRIRRDGELFRIGSCHNGLVVGKLPHYVREMATLVPSLDFPLENSIPERSVVNVRMIDGILGYFDTHGESLLPVALQYDEKEQEFYGICGKEITGKGKFPRYQFKDLTRGQV